MKRRISFLVEEYGNKTQDKEDENMYSVLGTHIAFTSEFSVLLKKLAWIKFRVIEHHIKSKLFLLI